jgi:hypothetical protein
LLCLFSSKILAQDPSQKGEQEMETFEKEYEKMNNQIRQNGENEEKIYEEEVKKLKIKLKNSSISKQEFNEQLIVLEKTKKSNINAKNDLLLNNIWKQFPWMGRQTFIERADMIKWSIHDHIKFEKNKLKKQIEVVDKELIEGTITKTQAEEQKMKLAEASAKAIESNIAEQQKKFSQLTQDEIEGKLPAWINDGGMSLTLYGNNISQKTKTGDIDARKNFAIPAMKAYNGQKDKDRQQNKRTSSQLVFAIGANNLATEGTVANSDFKYWQSRFYEWGLTFNSRIIPNHNLLHFKYGLSLMYNDLKPTDNRFFVDNGSQTVLATNSLHQDDSRFRNVNLVIPMHLEFDFTKPQLKDGKTYFKSHDSFRLGIGGYFGANIKSKQKINYDLNGYNSREIKKGDFNTNDFIYGVSTYLGYKSTSLYLKYDLNTLFENNTIKQNNISLGLRFDFN